MADYKNFGRLIKINGGGNDTSIKQGWSNYEAKKVNGNIVFADLHYAAKEDASIAYPKGYYIWANGVEYKVANLVEFNALEKKFTEYAAATDASIARLDTSVNTLEAWKAAMGFVVDENNKLIKITGVSGDVKFDGTEYVNVKVDGSTFKTSLNEDEIQYGDASVAGTAARHLATKGYVDDRETAIRSDVSAKFAEVDASISNVSTRLSGVVNKIDFGADVSVSNNKATVTLTETTEGGVETSHSYTVTGDTYVKVEGSSNDIKVKLDIYNSSLDSLSTSNASVYGAGSIKSYVDRKVSNLTGAIRLIGNVDSSDGSTATSMKSILTGADASKGNMWIATKEFDYTTDNVAMEKITVRIEKGDQVVITENRGTLTTDAPFLVIERNLDGPVTAGKNTFTEGHLIMGDATGKQTVIDSNYTLGGNDSSNIKNPVTNLLATEKAVHDFVEGRIADISVNADSSSAAYLNIEAGRAGDTFTVTSGVNVTTFAATEASTGAGTTLADAATFKKAIQDVTGTLVVEELADASANITLKMTGGDTSIKVNGGVYAEVNKDSDTTLKIEVKAVDLDVASVAADGLAIASNVRKVIEDNELANAAAHAATKEAIGLDDNLHTPWSSTLRTNLGLAATGDVSVMTVIETLDTSVHNEVARLDKRVDDLDVTNNDKTAANDNKLVVGVGQVDGLINVSTAGITINGQDFTRTHDSGNNLTVTIDGSVILVGGESRHKDSSIAKAIADLSTAIDDTTATYLKKVNGDASLVVTESTYAEGAYVSVSATPTVNNETTLDTAVLMANPVDVSSAGYTPATATGLASDAYVKDYVASILEWEEL